jgi:hypothetical protein
LSESEIHAIYVADSLGKCLVAPTIVAQPLSQAVPQNEDVKFSVSVAGSRPLKYQWRFNGQNLPRATNSTLILERLQATNIGFYRVVVSNALATINSAEAALKLPPPVGCLTPLEGMNTWWPADNSYADAVDSANPVPIFSPMATFATAGKVNQAFSFDGFSTGLAMSSSSSINFGANADFSIEGWIKALPPALLPGSRALRAYPYPDTPIVDKRSTAFRGIGSIGGYALLLDMGRLAFWLGTNAPLPTITSNSSMFISPGPDLRDGMFHHVALSLTRNTTNGGILCVDGNVVLTFDPTSRRGSLANTGPLYIGASDFDSNSYFFGLIDELTIYGRALSISEIQSIAAAGSAGKCKVRPAIVTQPVSQTVPLGSNATFTVVATGSPTLRYQWFRTVGGITVPTTNSMLVFSNVTSTLVGTYFVRVTNYFGSVTSSNAVLAVTGISPPVNSVLQFGIAAGQPLLQFAGVAGQPYLVQASTNLTDWTVIGTATDLGDGTFEFADPDWTNHSACFYRIILP